jgi:hypothetical protein
MAPKSEAGRRAAKWIEGLVILADSLGLRWFIDDHGTENLFFYIQDNATGEVCHGPFNSFIELEEKLNSLHLARVAPGQLS